MLLDNLIFFINNKINFLKFKILFQLFIKKIFENKKIIFFYISNSIQQKKKYNLPSIMSSKLKGIIKKGFEINCFKTPFTSLE